MTLRSFVDSRGHEWRVWATPTNVIAEPKSVRRHDGWLTFDSQRERRRLSPIPGSWSIASAILLESYCTCAEHVAEKVVEIPVIDADRRNELMPLDEESGAQ